MLHYFFLDSYGADNLLLLHFFWVTVTYYNFLLFRFPANAFQLELVKSKDDKSNLQYPEICGMCSIYLGVNENFVLFMYFIFFI